MLMKFKISLVLAMLLLTGPAFAENSTFYVVTNKSNGNSVIRYSQSETGQYQMIGEFKTGGIGTGDLEIPALKKDESHPLANGDDPLISANAIAATEDRRFVVVVNPGDSTISLMAVTDNLSLKSVNTVMASDRFPVSVAIYKDMVVAASVGNDNSSGSIAAFRIVEGRLKAVDDSSRDLKARPSTIAFSSDGEHVIVNELVTGKIKIFAVSEGTLSIEPVSMIDSPRTLKNRFQAIPVGFAVRGNGGDDVLIMSEARFLTPDYKLREEKGRVVQSPLYSWQTGSVSTYKLTDDGMISLVSGDILTGKAIESGEIANCWVALSKNGRTLYAANALSSSISTFDIDNSGQATLTNSTAFKDVGEALFFSDLAVSHNGEQLYQLIGNTGQVIIFDIQENGNLKLSQTVSGLPKLGSYGMLVY
jgi:6-phosphogluconolactonase (cycloisomerase 2 family)